MRKISLLNIITFLSAFLLFQIELIISKILLPDFGGSYMVWGACVVFFQAVLFLGYFFSYYLLKKIGIQRALVFYAILFVLPLFCFPGRSLPPSAVNLEIPLVINVFGHLLLSIGAVFFALSTTSIMVQAWLGSSELPEKNNPYALFAMSNLGSFGALITYPFFFEVYLDLGQQLLGWRLLYLLLLGLVIMAVARVKVQAPAAGGKIWSLEGVSRQDLARWLLFSAAGVMMFLSVTNVYTYEIAPLPLLWVAPLCIYLLSFVLNFKRRPFAPAWIEGKFYLTFAFSIVLYFLTLMRIVPLAIDLVATGFFLFHLCMFCQLRLHKSRPEALNNLPLFYLTVSLGGFLGGVFTTWVMPLISVWSTEYLVGLAVIAAGIAVGSKPARLGWRNTLLVAYLCALLILWPQFFKDYNVFGIVIIFMVFKICYVVLIKSPRAFLLSIMAILVIMPPICSSWTQNKYVYLHRNYYGIYKVYVENNKLLLSHGTTIHGVQYRDQRRSGQPLAYYHPATPIGQLLSAPDVGGRIGIIGLGSGGLAAYARDHQEIDYYEIDPDMYYIAWEIFSFLKQARGKFNFIYGDARITLKKAPEGYYDILVMDAFSGDAIPVHLLTLEAISEYRKHLKPGGVLLFHISNRYLDLEPVLFSNANALDAHACLKSNNALDKNDIFATSWFALTWDQAAYRRLLTEFKWKHYAPGKTRVLRAWTDKYSNMLFIISLENFLTPLKFFRPFYW